MIFFSFCSRISELVFSTAAQGTHQLTKRTYNILLGSVIHSLVQSFQRQLINLDCDIQLQKKKATQSEYKTSNY